MFESCRDRQFFEKHIWIDTTTPKRERSASTANLRACVAGEWQRRPAKGFAGLLFVGLFILDFSEELVAAC
jgi:hypothetical protein